MAPAQVQTHSLLLQQQAQAELLSMAAIPLDSLPSTAARGGTTAVGEGRQPCGHPTWFPPSLPPAHVLLLHSFYLHLHTLFLRGPWRKSIKSQVLRGLKTSIRKAFSHSSAKLCKRVRQQVGSVRVGRHTAGAGAGGARAHAGPAAATLPRCWRHPPPASAARNSTCDTPYMPSTAHAARRSSRHRNASGMAASRKVSTTRVNTTSTPTPGDKR